MDKSYQRPLRVITVLLLLNFVTITSSEVILDSTQRFSNEGRENAHKSALGGKDQEKEDSREHLLSLQEQLVIQEAQMRSLSNILTEKQNTLQETLKQIQVATSLSQWNALHLSALSTCTQFHAPTTKTLYPFIQGVSCAEVCARTNTQFIKCLAVVRVFLTGEGQAQAENVPLGHSWARSGSCQSTRYSLGSELEKAAEPRGYYTACCCGY